MPRPRCRRSGASGRATSGTTSSRCPSSFIVAGTSTRRTIVASTNTAVARPRPIILIVGSPPNTKLRNTEIMMSAAEVMTRAVVVMPTITDSVLSSAVDVLLADAAEEEHLVVHREPEQDREHEHRDEADDRQRLVDADAGRAPPLLEHEHDDAVGGADREQVHHRGLDRHEDRAEHDHQQDERQADDTADEQREPAQRSGRSCR